MVRPVKHFLIAVVCTASCIGCGRPADSTEPEGPTQTPGGDTSNAQATGPTQTQGGEPSNAQATWGIALPPRTQVVDSESWVGGEGASTSVVWHVSPLSVAEGLAHFASLDGAGEPYTLAGERCVDLNGTVVCVVPPGAVSDRTAPTGTGSWFRFRQESGPSPCPPCDDGAHLLPGCYCP